MEYNDMSSMIHLAKDMLEHNSAADQAIIIRTEEKIYNFFFQPDPGDVSEITGTLKADGNFKVQHIVCMWRNGAVDIPSYALRKALLEMNDDNKNALFVMQGENGPVLIPLIKSMP